MARQSTDLVPGGKAQSNSSNLVEVKALWHLIHGKQGTGVMGPQGLSASGKIQKQGLWAALSNGISAGEDCGSPQQVKSAQVYDGETY